MWSRRPAASPRRRHWWQILGLWIVGTAVLVPLVYKYIKPTYEAFAWLKIEPANRQLVAGDLHDPALSNQSGRPYLETQVQLITNPATCSARTFQDSDKVASLPRFRGSADAEAELRKALRVAIVPRTHDF